MSGSSGKDRVLVLLSERGPITQRELAELIQRKPATLCQQLEAMEEAGLVDRKPNGADRRTVDVCLTHEGEQAAREAIDRRAAMASALFGPLAGEDRAVMRRVLEELNHRWRGYVFGDASESAAPSPSAGADASPLDGASPSSAADQRV